jgi:hypothetical protein
VPAFLLIAHRPEHYVRGRLTSILAVWFVVQIVLPFTAPLHNCDLAELLGLKTRPSIPGAPTSGTPPVSEAEADANSFVSPLAASALRASTSLVVADCASLGGSVLAARDRSPSLQAQKSVLRL